MTYPYEQALHVAQNLCAMLHPYCERVVIAGSLRRRKPDVGDIELLAIPWYGLMGDALSSVLMQMIEAGDLFLRKDKVGRTTFGKKNKYLVHVASGIPVDIFSTTEECWAVALVVRTGPADLNKRIASLAIAKGWRWHAYGRGFSTPKAEVICYTEEDVFAAVGLPYKEPWERA